MWPTSVASPPGSARQPERSGRAARARRAVAATCAASRLACWTSSSTDAGASAISVRTRSNRSSSTAAGVAGLACRPSTARMSPTPVTGVAPSRRRCIRAARQGVRDLTRDGEHITALVEREIGGDQRPTSVAGLDDDRRVGQARRRSCCAQETATVRARPRAGTPRRWRRCATTSAASVACARG